jgi:flagellar motor switch protein FliG
MMIREEIEFLGPMRLSDVEGAQQRIVEAVRRLEEEGSLIISGRGGKEDVIV